MGGRWFLIFGMVLALFLASVASSVAEAGTAITRLGAAIKIQSDGTAFVEQVITYAEPSTFSWTAYSNVRNLSLSADGGAVPSKDVRKNGLGAGVRVSSSRVASTWVMSYSTSTSLIRHDDRDQLYLKLFERPGSQIYQIAVVLELPTTANNSQLSGDLYVLNGVLGQNLQQPSDRQIIYSAAVAGSQSLFTVSANWSKQALPLNAYSEFRLTILNLELAPWIVIGLSLPIIGALILAGLFYQKRRDEQSTDKVRSAPPSLLPPILAGIVVSKKIYPEQIVALIVDLCQRGYLVIVKKNHQYYLTPRASTDEHLRSWEREILEQIFAHNSKASADSLDTLGSEALFSPKVRDAFSRIYQVITGLEIFAENPHLTRIRYKLIALALYFGGVIGLILTAVFGTSPVLIIPFAGSMAIAYLIIKISPKLIRYTPSGLADRLAWLEFGNYLSERQPLPLESTQGRLFERYLAYAIALNKTKEWADRFDASSLEIVKPDWFITYEETSTSQLVDELVAFTGKISEKLATMKGPLVS